MCGQGCKLCGIVQAKQQLLLDPDYADIRLYSTARGSALLPMMTIEKLLEGLMVKVEPFVICRTTAGPGLDISALDFATLHYVVAGRGALKIAGIPQIVLTPGTIVILPPGQAHQLNGDHGDDPENLELAKNCKPLALGMEELGSTSGEGGIVIACSSIRATYQKVHGLFDYLPEPIVTHIEEGEGIGQVLTTLLTEMADPGPGSNSLISLLMQQCLVYVLRRYCASGNCQVPWLAALEDPQLSDTLEHMINDPGHRFTLDLLAESAGMSRSSFAQRFKAAFGRSAMDFLKELRLQRAAYLLRSTQRPIKSIADQVGFDSRSHFSQSFTEFFGTAPADFRNQHN
jgi:AraC-like DNA-binding protein